MQQMGAKVRAARVIVTVMPGRSADMYQGLSLYMTQLRPRRILREAANRLHRLQR